MVGLALGVTPVYINKTSEIKKYLDIRDGTIASRSLQYRNSVDADAQYFSDLAKKLAHNDENYKLAQLSKQSVLRYSLMQEAEKSLSRQEGYIQQLKEKLREYSDGAILEEDFLTSLKKMVRALKEEREILSEKKDNYGEFGAWIESALNNTPIPSVLEDETLDSDREFLVQNVEQSLEEASANYTSLILSIGTEKTLIASQREMELLDSKGDSRRFIEERGFNLDTVDKDFLSEESETFLLAQSLRSKELLYGLLFDNKANLDFQESNIQDAFSKSQNIFSLRAMNYALSSDIDIK